MDFRTRAYLVDLPFDENSGLDGLHRLHSPLLRNVLFERLRLHYDGHT